MRKLSSIYAAIALLSVGVANAGVLSSATTGGTRFAQEIFGTATDATTSVAPGVVTYAVTTTNGIFVNAGGVLYYTVRLTNGTFGGTTTVDAGRIGGTVVTGLGALIGPGVVNTSGDRTTVSFPVNFPSGTTIGVGATLTFTPVVGDIVGVKAALGTVGGTVSATAGVSSLAASAMPNPANPVPADVDGPTAATAVIAQSVNGFTAAVSVPSALTTRINVQGANPGTVFTAVTGQSTATSAPLGLVTFSVPTTPAKTADGTTDLTLATYTAMGASASVAVTPSSGAFPVNATNPASLRLVVGSDCSSASTLGIAVNITAANSAGPIALTLPQAVFTANTSVGVCLDVPAAPNGLQIPQVTPTIAVTTTPATALTNFATDTGSGIGYALSFNGALVVTPSYFPAAISQFGYQTFVRVINTGSTPTVVQGAFVAQNTGTVGNQQVLPLPANYGTTLAPGASITWTGAQIESALGAPGVLDRPRLQVSGTTSSLRVQIFVQAANGTFTELSSTAQ